MPRRRFVVDANEREAIAGQMQTAFEMLARERGHAFDYSGFDGPEKGRKLLTECGMAVNDLLLHNDEHLTAYDALRRLLSHQASPLDLAEFMFACVNGVPSTVIARLEYAGFSKGDLTQMAEDCDSLRRRFERLNCEAIPGPVSYLQHVQKLPPTDKILIAFQQMPEYLEECSNVLKAWPPADYTSQLTLRRFGKRYVTAYFRIYVLLCSGGNEEAVSAILMLMRDALFNLHSQVRSGRDPKRLPFLRYEKRDGKDPLSPRSLRVAVDRFVNANPGSFGFMLMHVGNYLREPKYKAMREQNHTFLELLGSF